MTYYVGSREIDLPFDKISGPVIDYALNEFKRVFAGGVTGIYLGDKSFVDFLCDPDINAYFGRHLGKRTGVYNGLSITDQFYGRSSREQDIDFQLFSTNSRTAVNFKLTGARVNTDLTRLTDILVDLKILDERLNEWGLPAYAKPGDAGMDLSACIDESITIHEGENKLIPTGIAIHINNQNVVGVLVPRSGLGHKKGMVLGNLLGIIDSEYQGQVYASMWNRKHLEHEVVEVPSDPGSEQMNKELQQVDNSYTIQPGDKICQLMFLPLIRAGFNVVKEFEESERGEGGFGNTS